jgi:undecaprenyl pyrophosphate phosphatase UppP
VKNNVGIAVFAIVGYIAIKLLPRIIEKRNVADFILLFDDRNYLHLYYIRLKP